MPLPMDLDRHPSTSPTRSTGPAGRYYTIRAVPYLDPKMENRLKAVHEARVKIISRA